MCRVMDEAINSGIQQGLEQGRKELIILKYQITNRYMEKFGGSLEDALDFAEITEEEYYKGKELDK